MDLDAMLAGKRVLATGASSGMGENFARLAAGCKAKVVVGARHKARLDKLAQARKARLASGHGAGNGCGFRAVHRRRLCRD